ncbi:MAG: RluA family pseudouridine synthase [Hydrogenoanaerobacterium sp.]
MSRSFTYTIEDEFDNVKIYDFLRHEAKLSYRLITSLKHLPLGIVLNGQHARTIDRLNTGDILAVNLAEDENTSEPSQLYVPIVYDDEDVLVYDKPAGMNCHQSRRFQNDTLANVFAEYCNKNALPQLSFRCLTRLDKDSSGLVLLAKNQHAAALLKNVAQKEYTALVCGVPSPPTGTIEAPISRVNEVYTKREVSPLGQSAVTHYELIKASVDGRYSLVRLTLLTGRTHQIRVHMAHIGCPLAGDDMYGGSTELIARQALHCGTMLFKSPISQKEVNISAFLPKDIQNAITTAKIYSNNE